MYTINFCFGSAALFSAKFGTILHFLGPSGLFFGLLSGSETFLGPTYVDNQLWFLMYSHIILFFNSDTLGATFALFLGPSGGYFFCLFKLFLWRSGEKTFLKPTEADNQLWSWKYNPIFLIWPNLGQFCTFGPFRG